MPLPQQVVNQLGQEPPQTPGWSSGVLFFSGAIFVIVLAIYAILTFVYTPYLNNQDNNLQNKVAAESQSISSGSEASIVTLYSQVSNLQSVLQNRILFSQFLSWLEQNTEANIYYTQLSFASASGDEITLSGVAQNEADINQQVAIFQSSPEIQNVSVSNVGVGSTGAWQFSATLIMTPSLFMASTTSL